MAAQPFINEFHYDNTGTDAGEFIEIAGLAGTNLAGYSLVLYNGSPTQLNMYSTINLSGVIANLANGYGVLSFAAVGLQNGNATQTEPDGIALVGPGNVVLEFISYEGSFTAASGVAAGLTSTNGGPATDADLETALSQVIAAFHQACRVGVESHAFQRGLAQAACPGGCWRGGQLVREPLGLGQEGVDAILGLADQFPDLGPDRFCIGGVGHGGDIGAIPHGGGHRPAPLFQGKGQVEHQAGRGMRELDLLIGRFAESRLASLTPDEMDQFEMLLDAPDPDMLAWLTGTADVPPEHDTPIYRALVAFHVHQGPLNR